MPLYGPMFIPSLFVTPSVLLMAYFIRRMRVESYPRFWWAAVVVCFLLTIYFTVMVLVMPLWSQQEHSPDNPGGFGKGSSPLVFIPVLFFQFFLVLPSFPTLFGLALMPPRNLPSKRQSVIIILYVVVVSAIIFQKNAKYVADYHQARQKAFQRGQTLPPPPSMP
jgi:hypothetical protein